MLTNRRTLLADEMGLGKTVQALSLLATEQAWPALIVVPPHLVRHWDKIPDSWMQRRTSFRYSLTEPEMQEVLGLKCRNSPVLWVMTQRAQKTALFPPKPRPVTCSVCWQSSETAGVKKPSISKRKRV